MAIMQQSDFGVQDYGYLSLHCVPAQIMSGVHGTKCREGGEVTLMFDAKPPNLLVMYFSLSEPTATCVCSLDYKNNGQIG